MADIKKLVSICVSVALLISFAGCGNKENTKTEQPNNEVVSQEPEKAGRKKEDGIVGTWVVEKNEIYEGPLKEVFEQMIEIYYPAGAEYIFTDDGICKSSDDKYFTTYEILSDIQISFVDVNTGQTNFNEYELNGDELVLYGVYTSGYSGRIGATYLTRK